MPPYARRHLFISPSSRSVVPFLRDGTLNDCIEYRALAGGWGGDARDVKDAAVCFGLRTWLDKTLFNSFSADAFWVLRMTLCCAGFVLPRTV